MVGFIYGLILATVFMTVLFLFLQSLLPIIL